MQADGTRVAERGSSRQEQPDVGSSEPVDRLLRVADEEQPPRFDLQLLPAIGLLVGRHRRDQRRELDLDRIGVLELVEQDVAVPLVECPANFGVPAQHPQCEDEQVVELEAAVGPPGLGRIADLDGSEPNELLQHIGTGTVRPWPRPPR